MPLQIDFAKDQVQLVAECAEIILYWRGSVFRRVEGVEHFYRAALQGMRDSVKWYETESMGEVRAVQPNTFELLPRWLNEPRSRRGMMALRLETAPNAESSSNLSFSIFCDEEDPQPMGFIRLVTPCNILERDPKLFLQSALYMADKLAFESGTAGYAINWDRGSELASDAEQHIARVAATYPGVEIPDPNTTLIAFQNAERPAFKRVNWVTFLGGDLVTALPPLDPALDIQVHELPHGRAVVAGAAPHRSQDLAAYHAVGRALAHFRVREHVALFGPEDDKSNHWLAAFD
jgi:hypothetical protein